MSGKGMNGRFSTSSRHYEYLFMPFWLVNSPSVFQSFINDVFRDINRWVIVYINDILIYSNSLTEHITHVRAVLQWLLSHQLYAKAEKCEFHQTAVSFLGYIISSEEVHWPQPTTRKELQHFLGFADFYRCFIRNFSAVATLLTSMLKGGSNKLCWSPAAVQSFKELKSRVTSAPILHYPEPNIPFIVEVDASNSGIGAILSKQPWNTLVHSTLYSTLRSGHPGIMSTLQLLWNRFWWGTMQADIITYINNCHTYAITKSFKQLHAVLLQPLPIPQRAWSRIAIDFITQCLKGILPS